MLRYNFSARYSLLAPVFSIILLLGSLQLWGQESVELITVKDVTPKKSFLNSLKGDFLAAPYYAGSSGGGFVMAYVAECGLSLVGNVLQGEDLSSIMFKAKYMHDVSGRFSIGPVLGYNRIKWNGVPAVNAYSLGGAAQYDTRDNAAAPQRGIYLALRQSCYTDFSESPYYGTFLQFDSYCPVWEGAVLASDIYGEFMYGAVPWGMLSTVGDSQRMRGYSMWDYRDNNAVSAQVELRQQVWSAFGVAVWGGGALLWGDANSFRNANVLPNAGVGVRCRLLDNLSIRLDWGVGKNGQNGFVFGINEAF